jgi:flagellar assembly factor FliW
MTAISETTSAPDTPRSVTSLLLGDLEVAAAQCFAFPEGIRGFDDEREFALLPTGHDGYWWLQSFADPGLLFVLADPFLAQPGYAVDLGQADTAFLGLTAPEEALVLTVVTLPGAASESATTNLRGPIVFNTRARIGRQVMSGNEGHGLQVPIPAPGA